MAAAFLRDYSTTIEVVSAGRKPLQSVDPLVVEVMKECLADLSAYRPRHVADVGAEAFDVVFEYPDPPCPAAIDDYRKMRDCVKNEAYLFFRSL
jgi:protein-tyrosine-phosphatase